MEHYAFMTVYGCIYVIFVLYKFDINLGLSSPATDKIYHKIYTNKC